MEHTPFLHIDHLTFFYPEREDAALRDVTLTVERGAFWVLCGPSGCGKSTLLRHLKPALAPHGRGSGSVTMEGVELSELEQREQSRRMGFVGQSPENQIVTDKVWHELAFGLESLGCDTPTIRRRVAEMASFFGIEGWFYKNVADLSGGQKQLLNLASVMAMQPDVLILDEPTSQLDPIAASEFLSTLGRINRELGTTVILTEHRLEDAFPLATQVAVLDGGRLLCTGTPGQVGERLREAGHGMFLAMPTAMRIWASVRDGGPCPVTVREGRDWLSAWASGHPLRALPPERVAAPSGETAIAAEELWFRYEKDGEDVVRGLTLSVGKGELLTLLGGNGTGKTTSLKLLAGLLTPHRGQVRRVGRIGVLPQNPQTLFVKKTVREDLFELLRDGGVPAAEREARVAHVTALCRLEGLLDRHPYDLSGGEQQRTALAKVLLLDPDILLMDEPTKGLDAEFKESFAQILRVLLKRGVAIVMVSHDIEFCAAHAHRCALFFDGAIVTEAAPRAFFSGNSFYTTSANRIARMLCPQAVTPEDVMAVCGGELPAPPELPEDIPPLPAPRPESAAARPEKLPLWRKLLAAASGVGAAVLLARVLSVTDLTALISQEGVRPLSEGLPGVYVLLVACLLVFAACVTRRSHRPDYMQQQPRAKRKLTRRTLVAAVLIVLLIPLTLFVGIYYLDGRKYYFIALLILLETMLPFFLVFEGRRPQARELIVIAVLCALAVAGRAVFFMLPQFKPVMALTIVAGVAFGGETGFLVGAMTILASNVLYAQGPWTPWQMFAMGIIGFLSGVLFRKGWLRRTRGALGVFGALCAILIYGGIMNPAAALLWAGELNWKVLAAYYVSGFPFDCIQAAATWLFLWVGAEPMLEKLDRIKVKYGLVE